MAQLSITAKGQVTLKKDLLRHLGLKPGEKIDVALLPNGRVELRGVEPAGSIDSFVGLLEGKVRQPLTVEQMNRIASEGWAKAHEDHR
ncbi:AbrB/MazE/SpoVT family DNA-binding domain-containing protein [Aestuariivirga sp.]|uniref:AbrB/MazE/SpoVT family DNA-binding domain-containing protein n=1 Tax=Aestuariivirga sp. TaxID=2650926 RepID=UPI0039E4CF2F